VIKFNKWIKIQLKKNEMQIDEKNIEILFMFKYVMLKRRIRKKQIFKKKINSCVFI
jgi:hypothetical protein